MKNKRFDKLCGLVLLASCVMIWGCPPADPSQNKSENGGTPDMSTTRPDMPAPQPDMGQMQDMPVVVELPPGEDISVATFNVERLFDSRCDSSCGSGDFEEVIDELELNSKISRIQRAIKKIDADVLVLQELEKESLLDRLMEGELGGEYTTQVYGESGFAGSMDVALIARGTLVKSIEHRDEAITTQSGGSEKFAREFLEVHIDMKGERVIAFGAHFISKASNNSSTRRWAEANAAGMFAAEAAAENPGALVVIAGDLNDTLDSSPLQALVAQGPVSTAKDANPNTHYTHVFRDARQIIDHIFYMPSDGVVPHPDGLTVLRDEGRDGLANSDHAAPRQLFRVAD